MKKAFLLLSVLFAATQVLAQSSVKVTQLSGKGDVLIFLPHIGCSSEMWRPVVTYYTGSHSCYLVDFAGFDRLKQVADPPYTEAYVRDLCSYIKANKLKNIIFVAQNYGAFVALKASQDKDLKIKAMIVSDFYPKLSMVLDTAITREKLEIMQQSVRKGMMESDSAAFAFQQKQTAEMMNFTDTVHVQKFVAWQLHSDRRTLAETLCEQLEGDLMPVLRNNKIPILAFSTWYFAKNFKQMPVTEAGKQLDRMYGKVPLIKYAVTEQAKDFMAIDQPEWFISEMNIFFKQQFGK